MGAKSPGDVARIAAAVQPLSKLMWIWILAASGIAVWRQLAAWCCEAPAAPDGVEMPEYAALQGPENTRCGVRLPSMRVTWTAGRLKGPAAPCACCMAGLCRVRSCRPSVWPAWRLGLDVRAPCLWFDWTPPIPGAHDYSASARTPNPSSAAVQADLLRGMRCRSSLQGLPSCAVIAWPQAAVFTSPRSSAEQSERSSVDVQGPAGVRPREGDSKARKPVRLPRYHVQASASGTAAAAGTKAVSAAGVYGIELCTLVPISRPAAGSKGSGLCWPPFVLRLFCTSSLVAFYLPFRAHFQWSLQMFDLAVCMRHSTFQGFVIRTCLVALITGFLWWAGRQIQLCKGCHLSKFVSLRLCTKCVQVSSPNFRLCRPTDPCSRCCDKSFDKTLFTT